MYETRGVEWCVHVLNIVPLNHRAYSNALKIGGLQMSINSNRFN